MDKTQWHERAKLRARILRTAVRNNHPETTLKALYYFKQLPDGKDVDLSADSFETVYVAGVMNENVDDYNFVLDKYLKTTFAAEQQFLLHALASTTTPYLQQRTLQLALLIHSENIIELY